MRKLVPTAVVLGLFISAGPAFALKDSTVDKAENAAAKDADEAGQVVDDSWITSRIKEQFFVDSLVKGRDISVTTKDHRVTLKGTVQSDAARDRAISIAVHTKGVSKLTDDLEVLPPQP